MELKKGHENKEGGEKAMRDAGNQQLGGRSLDTPLEDGQKRGIDADGQITQGTHGGPKEPPKVEKPGSEQGK
jgi:hypothetical protein